MKEIIARILNTANELDEAGLYQEATVLTKIAQELPFDPTAPGSANQFDSNLHKLTQDMGKMFNAPSKPDIYEQLKTFLSSLTAINTNYTRGSEVMIGAGMANHIKSEAQRLLEELKEYTGDEDESQEGPSDEWLEGAAERNLDNQQIQDERDSTLDSVMSNFPTTDWLDKYKS